MPGDPEADETLHLTFPNGEKYAVSIGGAADLVAGITADSLEDFVDAKVEYQSHPEELKDDLLEHCEWQQVERYARRIDTTTDYYHRQWNSATIEVKDA